MMLLQTTRRRRSSLNNVIFTDFIGESYNVTKGRRRALPLPKKKSYKISSYPQINLSLKDNTNPPPPLVICVFFFFVLVKEFR